MEISNPINWASDLWDVEDKYRILVNLLSLHCRTVNFDKINGENRNMLCTLKQNLVPEVKSSREQHAVRHDPTVIKVWCLDKQGWRSFRVENVKDVQVAD